MKSSQARPGRVFIIRLEHGDIIHECLERFAAENGITHAALTLHGGADAGSLLVTGPRDGQSPPPIEPQMTTLDDVHEVVGAGTIFPNPTGAPILHVISPAAEERKPSPAASARELKPGTFSKSY